MRLTRLKHHWDRLGRRDPLWAALTHPDKQGRGWNADAFFQSGREEVAALLARANELGVAPDARRALDFGCGAGRLAQAFAESFDQVDGVDISESMLDTARAFNRYPDRCHYHLNVAAHLALFGDDTFSFVHSTLVLQHMEPRFSCAYIKEFLRVARPDAVVYFQIPSHRVQGMRSASAKETSATRPLPLDACRARIDIRHIPTEALAGSLLSITVRLTNLSSHVWPALPDAKGRYRLCLGNHWLFENGAVFQRDDGRAVLPQDLGPGEHVDLVLYVKAPLDNGTYVLEMDMVQENVQWFADKGGDTVRLPIRVQGGTKDAQPPALPVLAEVRKEPLFRDRHPTIFTVLKSTGLRDAYWAGRRAIDTIKSRRDRWIIWLKKVAYEPTVPPLINWWNRLSFAPRMEMHPVSRQEVEALVTSLGATVLFVDAELSDDGYLSCRYWVKKGKSGLI